MTELVDALMEKATTDNTVSAAPEAKKSRRYSPEFRAEVIAQVKAGGTVNAVAKEHGVPPVTLGRWVNAAKPAAEAKAKSRKVKAKARVTAATQKAEAPKAEAPKAEEAYEVAPPLTDRQIEIMRSLSRMVSMAHEANAAVIRAIEDEKVRAILAGQNDLLANTINTAARVHRSELSNG